MNTFKIIAEIGCTHIGSLNRAKKLAKLAKQSGADVLKTQKRNPEESTKKELWTQPHPNTLYSYGDTYLDHRKNVELNIEEHKQLKQYCENIDIEYSTSVWDKTSAKEIITLQPSMIKIPSACNHKIDLINYIYNNYDGEIHISLGMLNKQEKEKLYRYLLNHKNRSVIYHCTSGYPVPFNKLYLKEIYLLQKIFPKVGFSNHGYGIAMEPVAYSEGAKYFERHFIDDRTFLHTDASCSLEPQGLSKLIRNLKAVSEALEYKPNKIDIIEQEQKNKLKT
jgi:sialic acid synthase